MVTTMATKTKKNSNDNYNGIQNNDDNDINIQ